MESSEIHEDEVLTAGRREGGREGAREEGRQRERINGGCVGGKDGERKRAGRGKRDEGKEIRKGG